MWKAFSYHNVTKQCLSREQKDILNDSSVPSACLTCRRTVYTLGNSFAYPGINITRPFCYVRGKCSFRPIWPIFMYWRAFLVGSRHISVRFYVCETTWCVPLLCFNMQTEMRFGVTLLLFPEAPNLRRWTSEMYWIKISRVRLVFNLWLSKDLGNHRSRYNHNVVSH